MKKFWLRVVLYTGYLSLAGCVLLGLFFLSIMLSFIYYFPTTDNYLAHINDVSEAIIYTIVLSSIYLCLILSLVRGIMSTRKILREKIPNKLDIFYIILLIAEGIWLLVWLKSANVI